MPAIVVAGAMSLLFLYFFNPAEISIFPRCPFYALSGLKCPGCGTLRGIHCLMHLQFATAWHHNPFMIVSMPVLLGLLISPRFRRSVFVSRTILAATIGYWVLRNVV